MRGIILIASLALVAACQNEPLVIETAEPGTTEEITDAADAEPRPITEPVELVVSETAQPSLLESAELRTADENEQRIGEGEGVAPGQSVEVAVRVKHVPEGLAAWVHWLDSEGKRVGEEQKTVPAFGFVAFRADTAGWSEGEYSAEIYIGGDLVDVKTFRVNPEQ